MTFQKIERMIENRLGTGVAAIAEKLPFSRARISDKRRGVPPGVRAHNTGARTGAWRIVTILVVLAVALSMVAPIAAASTATATSSASASTGPSASMSVSATTAPPSGMVGVPSAQVGAASSASAGAGPPADALDNIPTHAAAWDVHTDKHASTLALEIGATGSGELVLKASDDQNHAGRTIAVDAQTLAEAVGHRPSTAHGLHSSGSTWIDQIEYENGYAKIDVSRFSTNTITFDGSVEINATGATNATEYSYSLDDSSGVDSVNATLVGAITETDRSASGSEKLGNSTTISVEGDKEPVDENISVSLRSINVSKNFDADGVQSPWSKTKSIDVSDMNTVKEVYVNGDCRTYSCSIDAILDGTNLGEKTFGDDDTHTYSAGVDVSGKSSVNLTLDYHTGNGYWHGASTETRSQPPSSITVSTATDSTSVSDGGTSSIDINESGSQSLTFEGTGAIADYDLSYHSRADTADAALVVNGQETSTVASLSEGETANLSVDPSWIQDGSNLIEVRTGTTNGHLTGTDVEFSHSAPVDQTVEYAGETWTERYNVSRTWDSATTDASVTIPFASSRVIAIRDVEKRINGSSWQPVDSYTLDGTTLTAQLGDLNTGAQVDVRATGSKVQVDGGDISVTDPTVEGNSLDTALEITNHSAGFGIEVSGTAEGKWVHKTANESWTSPETFVTITAAGEQTVRAPGASAGSTMNVRTVPLEVTPDAGAVNLTLKESSKQLTFDVEPTSSVSEVTYRYHETTSGARYVLYSETHGVARDSDVAESPVSLIGGSYTETLSIILDSGSSSSSGTGGGGFGGAIGGVSSSANPLLVLVIGTVAIAGTAYVARRTGVPMSVVGGTGLLVAILGIETISPGTISDGLRSAIVLLSSQLGPVMPLIALILVGTGAYMAVRWWQGRTGPDTQVTLQLNGGNK